MTQPRNAAAAVVLALLLAAGCSAEAKQDAPVSARNTAAAEIINMPDGFSNIASKCDGPNRVYSIYRNPEASTNFGAVAVVPNDPRCAAKVPK